MPTAAGAAHGTVEGMPASEPVAHLYLHLLRSAAPAPDGLLTAALGRAGGDEYLTAALLARPEVDAATVRRLAGPVRGRSVAVWQAYLSRPELTDADQAAAIRAESRVGIRRELAGSGRTPPAALVVLAEDPDRPTRLGVLGNAAAPGPTRLSVLAGFEADLHSGTPAGRSYKVRSAELEEITSALRGHGFDPLADAAILQTTHPKLLRPLVMLRELPDPVAAHAAAAGVEVPLAALPRQRLGRKPVIEQAADLTHRLLLNRSGGTETGRAELRARLRTAWTDAGLTDDEVRGVRNALAAVGIGFAGTDITTRTLADAVTWASQSAATSAELVERVLAALGSDANAWQAFDAVAGTLSGPLAGTLLAAVAVGSAAS